MQLSSARQVFETRLGLGEAWQSQAVSEMELTRSSLCKAGALLACFKYKAGGPLAATLETRSDTVMKMDKTIWPPEQSFKVYFLHRPDKEQIPSRRQLYFIITVDM